MVEVGDGFCTKGEFGLLEELLLRALDVEDGADVAEVSRPGVAVDEDIVEEDKNELGQKRSHVH